MDRVARSGSLMEILQLALKKEQAAHRFYSEMRDHAKIDMVRILAEELCEEEQRHVRLIEKHIAALNLG